MSEFPLDDWGASSDLSNLNIKWFVPGEKEFRSVTSLLDTFLVKEVNRLEGFIRTGLEATDKVINQDTMIPGYQSYSNNIRNFVSYS